MCLLFCHAVHSLCKVFLQIIWIFWQHDSPSPGMACRACIGEIVLSENVCMCDCTDRIWGLLQFHDCNSGVAFAKGAKTEGLDVLLPAKKGMDAVP